MGIIWELYGIIWDYMELYGIIWNYMEFYGILHGYNSKGFHESWNSMNGRIPMESKL